MARKKKTKASGGAPQQKGKSAPARKAWSKYPFIALIVGGVVLGSGAYFLSQTGKSKVASSADSQVKKENVRLRETRPTLPPERFTGKVRRAYQIAREIPHVLDQLYCYCRCRENSGHLNLLSCYVGTHAAA